MKEDGVRERKRKETLQRITDAGLKLFATKGYDATTLDAIALEAGISRRTFFHYFKSKDDILISLHSGFGDEIVKLLASKRQNREPIIAVRDALIEMLGQYPQDELLGIDRLMRSSAVVQARKQASYAHDEAVLSAALQQNWPNEGQAKLRLIAMVSIGVLRLALDQWSRGGGQRPLTAYLIEGFDVLSTIQTGI